MADVTIRSDEEIEAAAAAMNGDGVGVVPEGAYCPPTVEELQAQLDEVLVKCAALEEAVGALPLIPVGLIVNEDGSITAVFEDGSEGPFGGDVPIGGDDTFLQPTADGDPPYAGDADGIVEIPLVDADGNPTGDVVQIDVTSPSADVVVLDGDYENEAAVQAAAETALAGLPLGSCASGTDGCYTYTIQSFTAGNKITAKVRVDVGTTTHGASTVRTNIDWVDGNDGIFDNADGVDFDLFTFEFTNTRTCAVHVEFHGYERHVVDSWTFGDELADPLARPFRIAFQSFLAPSIPHASASGFHVWQDKRTVEYHTGTNGVATSYTDDVWKPISYATRTPLPPGATLSITVRFKRLGFDSPNGNGLRSMYGIFNPHFIAHDTEA